MFKKILKYFNINDKRYLHADVNGKLRTVFTNEQIIKDMLEKGYISKNDDLCDYTVIDDIELKMNGIKVHFYIDDFILEREDV